MKEIAVIAAKRSPIGKVPGELNYINETELISLVFKNITSKLEHIRIDEAILGSSFPIEKDNLCRKAVLKAGISSETVASTISKTCASSDEALSIACNKILSGNAKSILVGGCEKISNSSYTLHYMKQNIKRAIKNEIPDFINIQDNIMENDMVYMCEMLGRKYNITRKMQDKFTLESIKKAVHANENKYYSEEMVPINYISGDQEHYLKVDEMLSYERTAKDIYDAIPMFVKDGFLTQYNAAPMCDCAAAILLMDYDEAIKMDLRPKILITDTTSIGVSKDKMGWAMTQCVNKILHRNNLRKDDIDLYEINESFAAQAIFTSKSLDLDMNKVNVNGGNLAIGYPIGATGLRMSISLIHEMIRRQVKFGLSVMCAGGNMANAVVFKNVMF